MKMLRAIALVGSCWLAGWTGVAQAQTPPAGNQSPASQPPAESNAPPLAGEQQSVAERFRRLETLLLRSADLEAGENPARAALLQQAVQLSQQAELSTLLADAAARLQQGQYSEAIEKQKISRENLKRLLELLQSENRAERIREERDEVRRWIEETDRLLRLQSSLRGRTEGGQATEQAAQDQRKLSDKAESIAEQLRGGAEQVTEQPAEELSSPSADEPPEGPPDEPPAEAGDAPVSDSKESDSKGSDSKGSDAEADKPAEGNQPGSDQQPENDQAANDQPGSDPQPGSPQAGEKPPGDKPPGASQPSSGEPSSGEPSSGEPSSGEPSSGEQTPQPATPSERAQQKIEQARENMRQAQQQLEQAEREGAVEEQRAAEERLREAIEELEEILRQLREEEVERSLASLETRLRRMLEMQTKVWEESQRLQEISGPEGGRQVQIAASKLAVDQRKILAEGERAYLLLRDEGSSAAFPEALEQLNGDIATVAERLTAGDVGGLTVSIEQEIVSSLEEMVEALVQVQKENRERQQQRQQGQPPPGGEPGDQPLVDKLAELRLIRTLQVRINNRTASLSQLLTQPDDPVGQAEQADIREQLQELSTRQASIQRVTRDIVVGKGE